MRRILSRLPTQIFRLCKFQTRHFLIHKMMIQSQVWNIFHYNSIIYQTFIRVRCIRKLRAEVWNFSFFLCRAFVSDPIWMQIYSNANIIKTQIFFQWSMTSEVIKGQLRWSLLCLEYMFYKTKLYRWNHRTL